MYLGLGSNLGNRKANLRAALSGLAGIGRVVAVSALYETEPAGGPPQPSFYNAACTLDTSLEPAQLLSTLQELEHQLGRRSSGEPWGPRPIDLDILLYEDIVVDQGALVIPHPRLAERPFVLVPLADIAAELRHPVGGQTIGELLAAAGTSGTQRIAEVGWDTLEGKAESRRRL